MKNFVSESFNGSHVAFINQWNIFLTESSSGLSSLICSDTNNEVFPVREYLLFYKKVHMDDASAHILTKYGSE